MEPELQSNSSLKFCFTGICTQLVDTKKKHVQAVVFYVVVLDHMFLMFMCSCFLNACPPLWFIVNYLNNNKVDCHKIMYNYLRSTDNESF